ncbi:MAG: Transcription termination/antitermination protein NusA [Chlamydiia bacterium]|nr:Transcription termination/antitermination protein NusA [Chlamydiia bacterium]
MKKELVAIFEYLEREKGIKRDLVVKAIEDALVIAARKGPKGLSNLTVHINPKTGDITSYCEREIVEEVEYPEEEICLEEAQELDPESKVGDWIEVPVDPEQFGRIAAQTARQVIAQKIRYAERDVIHEEYRHRIGELVSGSVVRLHRGGNVLVDLGKVEGLLPGRNYPKSERYHIGDKVLALLHEVEDMENGGAQVILTRSHPDFVKALFDQEVSEVHDGTVELRKVVRDAGYRTKLAVYSSDLKVDPVGACVGVRGNRVKNIIRELNNEKIDILPYSDDPFILLKNALSPCEFKKIHFDEEENQITIIVDDEDYPAVLGKKGSNARLIGELIGMEISIIKSSVNEKEIELERQNISESADDTLDEVFDHIENVNPLIVESLLSAEINTPRKILKMSADELAKSASISPEMADSVIEEIAKQRETHFG